MKLILVMAMVCSAFLFAVVKINKDSVVVAQSIPDHIPIEVTLTKYQLERMLRILEEENSYGRPADPQDMFTFTSVAKGNEYSKQYNVSSTHLARKPIK